MEPCIKMKAQDLDLRKILNFNPDEGKLKIGNERVLLFSQHAFHTLRNLMYDQLGDRMARSIMAKFGYQNGAGDYRTLTNLFHFEDENERLAAGPIMHSWSGIVKVEPILMEMDRKSGHFHFKGIWKNSYEADIHIKQFGFSDKPVCHTLCGYGSGWCSEFFGIPLLEIETKCMACGDEHCEWEIKPFHAWGDEAKEWKEGLSTNRKSIFRKLEETTEKVRHLNENLENEVKIRIDENKNLLRILCHDLTVPLEMMKNSIQSIQDKNTPIEISDEINSIQSASFILSDMIAHVKNNEAQKHNPSANKLELVSLGSIFERVKELFRHRLQEKNIILEIENKLAEKDWVAINPLTFTQEVLCNLFSNAIKFSPSGGKLKITIEETKHETLVTIKDQGIGIPSHLIQKIMSSENFESRLGTHGESGTGFGMRLVRDYLRQNNGSLEIRSTTYEKDPINCGTTFIISLMKESKV